MPHKDSLAASASLYCKGRKEFARLVYHHSLFFETVSKTCVVFSYAQEEDGPCLGIATRQALRSLLPRIVEEARAREKHVKGVG